MTLIRSALSYVLKALTAEMEAGAGLLARAAGGNALRELLIDDTLGLPLGGPARLCVFLLFFFVRVLIFVLAFLKLLHGGLLFLRDFGWKWHASSGAVFGYPEGVDVKAAGHLCLKMALETSAGGTDDATTRRIATNEYQKSVSSQSNALAWHRYIQI